LFGLFAFSTVLDDFLKALMWSLIPYGANDGYQLVSRDASRARPQVVKTATSGNIGKNASHLQVRVEDFAGEPTICLLAVPYSEETIAMRNKSRDERNKAHKARNPKKVSQKNRSK